MKLTTATVTLNNFFHPLATKLVESVKVLIFKTNIKILRFFFLVLFAALLLRSPLKMQI